MCDDFFGDLGELGIGDVNGDGKIDFTDELATYDLIFDDDDLDDEEGEN